MSDNKITEKQAELVLTCIDLEGFDYCFREYSSFKQITDPEFRTLLQNYRNAADALEKFLYDAAPNHEENHEEY